jgi:CBS domain-containing protein
MVNFLKVFRRKVGKKKERAKKRKVRPAPKKIRKPRKEIQQLLRSLKEKKASLRKIEKEVKKFTVLRGKLKKSCEDLNLKIKTLKAEVKKLEKERKPVRIEEALAKVRREVYEKISKLKVRPVLVKHVMTKDVKFASPNDVLRDVIEIFSEHRISGVPVTSNDKLVGIITESDIFKLVGADSILDIKDTKFLETTRVKDAMTKNVITVNDNDSLEVVVALLNKTKVNRFPVVDKKGKVIGIIARDDVIKGIMEVLFFHALERVPYLIETDIDRMLALIRQRPMSIDKLAKEIGVEERQVEDWARILERSGIVEVLYPPIGKPVVKMIS